MNTHTPGPWHLAEAQYNTIGIARMQDGIFQPARVSAAITGRSRMDGGEGWHYVAAMNSHAESEADARLMTAAPDLLAALQFIDSDRLPEDMRTYVRAVIAKAIG